MFIWVRKMQFSCSFSPANTVQNLYWTLHVVPRKEMPQKELAPKSKKPQNFVKTQMDKSMTRVWREYYLIRYHFCFPAWKGITFSIFVSAAWQYLQVWQVIEQTIHSKPWLSISQKGYHPVHAYLPLLDHFVDLGQNFEDTERQRKHKQNKCENTWIARQRRNGLSPVLCFAVTQQYAGDAQHAGGEAVVVADQE